METTEIKITIPKDAACYINPDDIRTKALLFYPAISDMKLSRGRVAELLGIGRLEMLDMLADMDIPYITQTWEEVQQDMDNYENLVKEDSRKAVPV
ncbi:MAG: UPF0175 family protein [Treponema sp.]|nr:UPF0175 family protein [Treponema sp.]